MPVRYLEGNTDLNRRGATHRMHLRNAETATSAAPWSETADVPSYPPLRTDVRADVCVIGAGIAGVSTAYTLAQSGRTVVLVDDGDFAHGETSHTTAHLSTALDDRYTLLERLHGEKGARLAAQSHTAAIRLIEELVRAGDIDCGFRRADGFLFLGGGDAPELLERELEAAARAGVEGVQLIGQSPFETVRFGRALRFPQQAQFHPLRYVGALVRALERAGAQLHCGTRITDVEGGAPCRAVSAHGPLVTADAIVVATNSPFNDRFLSHIKQAPYRTFVVGFRAPAGSIPLALFWDTPDPYHYVRIQPGMSRTGDDLLIAGGEDHKTGQHDDAEDRFARIEEWARGVFPTAGEVEYRWSGQVMEPADAMALIGPSPNGHENVFVATGDSGHGMTHGTIAGMLLTDLISGRDNPWAPLYDPRRITLNPAAVKELAKENLNVALRYGEWILPGDVSDSSGIPSGEGAVLREGRRLVAVYRDSDGRLHRMSAACTHLGCVVSWNSREKSWDCPCHGSRFQPLGKVLNGPASVPLERLKD